MNLYQYQKKAITTKIYADEAALSYLGMGLAGESSELFEKIRQNRDGITTLEGEEMQLLAKEIGDTYWYLAGLAEETDQSLEDILKNSNKSLQPDVKFDEIVDELIIQTGVVLEVFKKALRDDYELFVNKKLTDQKFEKMNDAIAYLLLICEYLANFFGVAVSDILQQNVDKLASRAERGVLGGSGDKR